MLKLHVNVYAMPSEIAAGPVVELRGLNLPTLINPTGGPPLFAETLSVTFEQMQQQLAQLPSCDYEPDGFFLVTGRDDEVFWRLNGHMHEYGDLMHRVELNGECTEDSFDAVLQTMGWPDLELAFELVQEGITLRENDFRHWALTIP